MKNSFRYSFLCGLAAMMIGFFAPAPQARAGGFPVVDILANGNILSQTVMQITEFGEQIGNQVRQIAQAGTQIEQLYTQIQQYYQMLKIIGDPSKLLQMLGITQFVQSFTNIAQMHAAPPIGSMFTKMSPSMISSQSLMGNGSQMFSSGQAILPQLTSTINGVTTTIQRDLSVFKNIATMEQLFLNLTNIRATDKQVQQAMNTQIQQLTNTLHTATDQSTIAKAIAGIQTAHATMAASTAEVAKTHADYQAAQQQRVMQDQKQVLANQQAFDAQMAAGQQQAATTNKATADSVNANIQSQAAAVDQNGATVTAGGYDDIPIK